jgi:hypothetical protein
LDSGKKGSADVFHQVPPIGDLNGVRTAVGGSLPVTGATVARDNHDRRVLRQPPRRRLGVSVRQNVNDASPFQVANDRPVAVAPLPREVINPDDPRFLGWLNSATPDNAQQGVIADGQQQAFRKALSRSTAQRQAQMMNNPLKTRGSPCERGTNRTLNPFGENLPTAIRDQAA